MDFNELMDKRKERIMGLISEENYKPLTISELCFFMEVPSEARTLFHDVIAELCKEGKVFITKKEKIILPEKLNMVAGIFHSNAKGFGFVTDDNNMDKKIFIAPSFVNGAAHKDHVLCRVLGNTDRRPEGEIIEVLKRGYDFIVGTFERSKNFGFVLPDDKRLTSDIFVSNEHSMGAVTGHKVVVKITKNSPERRNPEGKITEILGHTNDVGVDILSIVRQYELPVEFPEKVMEEIQNIPFEVSESDLEGRVDLREEVMVTIDGEDSKDLDDAISIGVLENGNYKLGVHIADVSHYVKENSPLDQEAYKRGTSIYLVDRVIPMLPHKLSNGICSLNEKVDRLALSCEMELDQRGNIVSHRIFESVININRRMTYTIVSDILTNSNSVYKEEYNEFESMFRQMEALCHILRNKRVKRGAIEFSFSEAKIVMGKDGVPIDVKLYERNIATKIIEEFMLASNETIAEDYFWQEIPFVYRNHETPDSEKMEKLSIFINNFGYNFKTQNANPKSIQKLLAKFESTKEEMIVSRVVLRSLKQARYTESNDGHFGLAAKYYCHFTSPIRRYPDLQIHRIIKRNLAGKINEKEINHLNKILPEVSKHCSIRERVAEEAEREVESLKKVQFMSSKVGQVFKAVICSVTSWGIFVELENTIEGMVSLASMEDDYYIYDEAHFMVVGEHTKKIYRLGDVVTVKLVRANMELRNLDFIFE